MDALADVLTALYCRPGSPAAQDDPALHREHIARELASGQWVLLADPEGPLWGWLSWYRTNRGGLALLRTEGMDRLVQVGLVIPLSHGPHAYVATAVVAPWAPPATYRTLYALARARLRTQGVETIAAHLRKRDGRACWHQRRIAA